MKRLILSAVCVSLLAMGSVAEARDKQPEHDMRPRHEMKMHEDLAQKLGLTEEQKALADKIREDGRKQMKPLMEEQKLLREKMDKLRKANMEEFEKILTQEQKETFDKIKKDHRPPHGRRKMHAPELQSDDAGAEHHKPESKK